MPLYSVASSLLHIGFFLTFLAGLFTLAPLFSGAAAPKNSSEKSAVRVLPASAFSTLVTWSGFAVIGIALLTTAASAVLLYAFINHDFIVEYVASYSDTTLPLFYRITAFWAGQNGSLLFWAWSVAVSGAIFVLLPSFKRMSERTKLWFCLIFLCIMGFFLLLLSLWSNPFDLLDMAPQNGRGLNPLLQNLGMIFHPPLLFLGYGGFVVPGCLALAQALSGNLFTDKDAAGSEESWEQASRPFILIAWSLLTAGIVLGAWWAYMELGWGGYWAWDPVENASLIPWLVASAYLHTAVIGSRRGKLQRTNVFLMALTTISAFFATYLVRSGVVQSLHAFGSGTVGAPLIIFILAFLYLSLAAIVCAPGAEQKKPLRAIAWTTHGLLLAGFAMILFRTYQGMGLPSFAIPAFIALLLILPALYRSPNTQGRPLEEITTKEGLLLIVAWLLLALSFMILVATMWPVILDFLKEHADFLPGFISARLPQNPSGLEAAFYNRTCLPLFALFAVLLVVCPFRKWRITDGSSGFVHPALFLASLAAVAVLAGGMWVFGIRNPVALLAASCSLAAILGIAALFGRNRRPFSVTASLAAHGVHAGLLMIVLGVAFSGPYQEQYTLQMGKGQLASAGSYQIRLNQLYEGESQIGENGDPNFTFLEAELIVADTNGRPLGVLSPQRRLYANFTSQTYAEVDTLFSLGKEIYATLLSIDDTHTATLMVNINPLINWLWIGGTVMCLFPFLSLRRVRRMKEEGL